MALLSLNVLADVFPTEEGTHSNELPGTMSTKPGLPAGLNLALYRAKDGGRNRVELGNDTDLKGHPSGAV
jgi:hypothetical protein